MELVDTLVLGTSASRRGGSSPSMGTKILTTRRLAQPGSALALGARGRKFESCISDQHTKRGRQMRRRQLDFALGFLFCFILIIAVNVYGQTITVNIPERGMHDTVHEIMEQSNPSCYITGTISHVKMDNGRNGYRQLKNIVIEPEYYIWEQECDQFKHNHFTDFEVPKLHQWHLNSLVRVQYIKGNGNWFIHNVVPVLASN